MEQVLHMWNKIVMSNTFNFVIFVAILVYVFKKINIGNLITSLQTKIKQIIEAAKSFLGQAVLDFKKAEDEVKNVPQDVKKMISDAENTAEILSKKILEDANKQVQTIEKNAQKLVEAEEKKLSAQILQKTSKASVEIAKDHIKNVLNNNPNLHEKYINESIDALDRLNF